MLTPAYYDPYVAPDFSKFKGAELEDLSELHPEQSHWLYNFILNHDSVKLKPKFRELVFNHLRRVHGTFDAYGELRRALIDYRQSRRRVRDYFMALSHAEVCVSFAGQAIELGNAVLDLTKTDSVYMHAAKADFDKIREFYKRAKHIPNMIHGSQLRRQDTLVFWFTNEGLRSRRKGLLSFAQLASVLRELAYDATQPR
jgi:hypothetical protein